MAGRFIEFWCVPRHCVPVFQSLCVNFACDFVQSADAGLRLDSPTQGNSVSPSAHVDGQKIIITFSQSDLVNTSWVTYGPGAVIVEKSSLRSISADASARTISNNSPGSSAERTPGGANISNVSMIAMPAVLLRGIDVLLAFIMLRPAAGG